MIFYVIYLLELINICQSFSGEPKESIPLNYEMVVNETAIGNAEALVDEQKISSPKSKWSIGWRDKSYFPLSVVLDLGSEYLISEIALYDGQGNGMITVNTGTPLKWEKTFSYNQNKYNQWEKKSINKTTRYLQIVTHSNVVPYEVLLYGEVIEGKEKKSADRKPSSTSKSKQTVDKLIGINAFIDDPIERLQVASFVREYHNWRWDASPEKYPDSKYAWNPSYAGGGWDFDNFYRTLAKLKIEVIPCVKSNPDWINGNLEDKPIINSANSESPYGYSAHAEYLYQYVARYGNNKIDPKNLKLDKNQVKISGLNLISYIENWNEQNKTWEGIGSYFTPYEYAAMTSADYDAHQSKLEGNVGVKKADPGMKMVMGGLAGLDIDYVKSIKFWSDHHRNGSVPFDVINLHHYCNTGDKNNPIGISPEADNFRSRLEDIVEYRDKNMPGKEIWITEFGYDTHPQSPQRVPEINGFSREEVQGQWLVRSYLEIAAAGIDRAAMYMLRDANTDSKVKYATSGLTLDRTKNWEKKPSWNYIYTLKSRLKGMVFKSSTERSGVRTYKFENEETKDKVYVLWSPTSENNRIENFRFKLNGDVPTDALIVSLNNTDKKGTERSVKIKDKTITATVTESPIFLILKY